VLTYEISEAVLTLARFNPIGGKLFETRNVKVEQGNIAERISELPDRSIDVIIHDPPRFSLAPELYSTGFYEQMKRVLKANGRLFHYTGSVGHKRKRDIASEISGRMKAMGFRTRKIERLQGLVATMTTF
jgi:predicted methyltransferase